jgi:hypothetical protein
MEKRNDFKGFDMLKILTIGLILTFSLGAFSQEGMFDQMGDKAPTEAEKGASEQYIHKGISEQVYREGTNEVEGCINDEGIDRCTPDQNPTVISETGDNAVEALAKIYGQFMTAQAMMGMMSGKTPQIQLTEPRNQKDSMNDYCAYVPIVSELAAAGSQKAEQTAINKVEDKASTIQYTSLSKSARAHEARTKTATIQASGWGITAGCYAVMIAIAGGKVKPGTYVKMAGSAALSTYFTKKAVKHKRYREEVEKIRDSLPGRGECNPFTDTHCFCQEDSSAKADPNNYMKYCSPDPYLNRTDAPIQTVMTCVDSNLKEDPQCKCKGNNSCFSETFKRFSAKLNSSNAITGGVPNISGITDGVYDGATLAAQGKNGLAMAKKIMDKYGKTNKLKLDGKQSKQAKALANKLGIPASLAAYTASAASIPQGAQMVAKLKEGNPELSLADLKKGKRPSNISVVSYKTTGGNKKFKRKKSFSNPFAKFGKKKKKKDSVQVMKFADEARRQAEISQESSDSIFGQISRRYQMSGRKSLEVE